jgi:outer membrane protein TolC
MKVRNAFLLTCAIVIAASAYAQESKTTAQRGITLDEAVQLALKNNHLVRLASLRVEESQHAKDIVRSSYFPNLKNDSNVVRVTDTQFIAIPKGELGTAAGVPIPEQTAVLNQGGLSFLTSGTQVTQPIIELWKVRSANDIARAETDVMRNKALDTRNQIALQVHQLYYKVLILQTHRAAAQAKIQANDDLRKERIEQVKVGSTLEQESIEARAETLGARQELLSTELQLADSLTQLNDAIGLPLTTQLVLNESVDKNRDSCERENCLRTALDSHPEIREARAEIEKASAAVRLAKRQYLPSLDAFARYTYSNDVPFLARNFGTFGLHFGYEIFDGGKRNAEIGERKSQLAEAEENLARMKDEVEVRIQTIYNKRERTRDMLKVSEELLALRSEVHRVAIQQQQQGAALSSQVNGAAAQELYAKTALLQSQLDYLEAEDEMLEAEGITP